MPLSAMNRYLYLSPATQRPITRAIRPILPFLRDTEVGSRDGTRERELEWQWRSDQEG